MKDSPLPPPPPSRDEPPSELIATMRGALEHIPRSTQFELHRPEDLPGLELHRGKNVQDVLSPHVHDAYDLVLIQSGTRHVMHRERTQVLGPGSLFINTTGEPHAGQSPEGWSFSSLYLPPSYLLEAHREVGHGDRQPSFSSLVLEHPGVVQRFQEACAVLASGDGALASESVLLATLVSTLLQLADGRPHLPALGQERQAVKQVQQYLQEHLADNVRLETLAQLTGLSSFHLIRVFRAATGVAPHAYQLQLRIHWAKVLLTQGLPLVDVALEAGFVDQSHFTRKFKQVVGLTPKAFQKRSAGR